MWNLLVLKRMVWLCVYFAYGGNSLLFAIVRYNLLNWQQDSHQVYNLLRTDKVTPLSTLALIIVKQVAVSNTGQLPTTYRHGQKNNLRQIFTKT